MYQITFRRSSTEYWSRPHRLRSATSLQYYTIARKTSLSFSIHHYRDFRRRMRPWGHYTSSLRELCNSGTISAHSRTSYSVLVFMSTSGKGFQVPYTTITLHAISRSDLAPSIYCQLDEAQAQEEEPTQDEEAELEMRELRIVPSTSESRESCADLCWPIIHPICALLQSNLFSRHFRDAHQ